MYPYHYLIIYISIYIYIYNNIYPYTHIYILYITQPPLSLHITQKVSNVDLHEFKPSFLNPHVKQLGLQKSNRN